MYNDDTSHTLCVFLFVGNQMALLRFPLESTSMQHPMSSAACRHVLSKRVRDFAHSILL